MNKKNLSNPIYKRLFPETYSKYSKIKETIADMSNKFHSEKLLLSQDIAINNDSHNFI